MDMPSRIDSTSAKTSSSLTQIFLVGFSGSNEARYVHCPVPPLAYFLVCVSAVIMRPVTAQRSTGKLIASVWLQPTYAYKIIETPEGEARRFPPQPLEGYVCVAPESCRILFSRGSVGRRKFPTRDEDCYHMIVEHLDNPQDQLLSYQGLVDYVNTKLPIDEEYFIVAESFAGPIAISIASQHPKHLKCIILVATFAYCPFPKLSPLALKILPFFIKLSVPQRVISFFLLNGQRQEMAKAIQNTIRTISRDALLCRIRNVLTCDVTRKLQKISIPVLAIQANQDRLLPNSCIDIMSKHLPMMRVVGIDASHFVLQAEPQAVSEKLIKPFLQEIL